MSRYPVRRSILFILFCLAIPSFSYSAESRADTGPTSGSDKQGTLVTKESPKPPEPSASVELFSPQGEIKKVRQVTVRFSEQMVPFGDQRIVEPFDIRCQEKGSARWADGRNWVYDFDKDLSAGISCEFILKQDLKTLSGKTVKGNQKYVFSTGGPAVVDVRPQGHISEDQIFILKLDAEATTESMLANVSCIIEGINERVGIRIIEGEQKERIVSQQYGLKGQTIALVQCRQNFPNRSEVKLVWGKGVAAKSGISTSSEQVFTFKTRDEFSVRFNCQRENKNAGCIPILPMRLNFSEPVSWELAGKIVMKGNGKTYRAEKVSSYGYGEEGEGEGGEGDEPAPLDENTVYGISFKGPFSEHGSYVIEIPKDLKDDAGRLLSNISKFPLTVRTDGYPPLAKFAASFGIIELNADPTLPVTLRNLEPKVRTRLMKAEEKKDGLLDKAKENVLDKTAKAVDSLKSVLPESVKPASTEMAAGLKGRLKQMRMEKEEKIIEMLGRVLQADREKSVFRNDKGIKEFDVPKPGGEKAFEVVGIPLKEAGFYAVEMESTVLGDSLLEEKKGTEGKRMQRPMYVPTAVLVTNLSAHFKHGRESSLIWVTTLDKGMPVKDAQVEVRDCRGKVLWKGKTGNDGAAYVKSELKEKYEGQYCSYGLGGLFVFAKTSSDMTFVHSGWDDGIEPWRYSLYDFNEQQNAGEHTVFDRSLLRAGETVHMKHIARNRTMSGFGLPDVKKLAKTVTIIHMGSEQKYEFPLKWDSKGIAETEWQIPKDAKLGTYSVTMNGESGSFRVEEFRVPLMKALIQPPKEPLVKSKEAETDLYVSYLSGGGAGNMKVKLRSQVQRRFLHYPDYDDFSFGGGEVKEEIIRRGRTVEQSPDASQPKPKVQTLDLVLDRTGSLRTKITNLPDVSEPHDIHAELEFMDPNGEVQTTAQKIHLWPSGLSIGIKPDSWAVSKEAFRFHTVLLDLSGKPVQDRDVKVDLFQRKFYSHRKRLVGGFYSYEHVTETKRIGQVCEGKTDAKGLLICDIKSPVTGNVILQARAADDKGNVSMTNREVWVAGKGQWWFDVSDHDRIDILPEKKRYEPGETAKFQVRMPFREATALVTVEREGVIESYVKRLSGSEPVIELPIKGNYAPNVFVSALVVRGRVSGVQPTALVDLGKPAYKLGISGINVGWKAHELKVSVIPEKEVYKIRQKTRVKIKVIKSDGKQVPKGSEVAVAAVDEGLLELMPNRSWKLLDAMMGRRSYEVHTSTAQMQVVGKRHYGLKALPQGGGGGKQPTREMFDTLLLWKGRLQLNEKGEAEVEIPLNDALTGFRIVAVATAGTGLFGTGQASIRTTQEIMLLSGLPQLVREGDRFRAGFTVRNASDRKMDVELKGLMSGFDDKQLDPLAVSLDAGESKDIGWDIKVPAGSTGLSYEVSAKEVNGTAEDKIRVKQKVVEAVPVRVFQSTLMQVDTSFDMDVERPKDSVAGKGGVSIFLKPKIASGLGGVTLYMKQYPYTCMEQKVSRAVALRDGDLWIKIVSELPAYMDNDGMVKYFPLMQSGSDTLTSYILSLADEAGLQIPEEPKKKMLDALKGFVEGKIRAYSPFSAADLTVRKLSAIDALSRNGMAEPKMLDPIMIEPNLWPTSAVLDWTNILLRMKNMPQHDKRLKEAEQIIRARLNFQGTTMGFSTEATDNLWWLMISTDLNAVKSILTFLNFDNWKDDMPRLVRGALSRQKRGHWSLTTANAWGMLAMEKFSQKFESVPLTGSTAATLDQITRTVDWKGNDEGMSLRFGWPKGKELLSIQHRGRGMPWVAIQGLAAIPLKEPLSSGYKMKKTFQPVEQKEKGKWSKGDVVRVRLELEAQADMTWVAVTDPIPAGANILGTGLGRDSQIMTSDEKREGWVWPAFEERSFEAFRAYYEYVRKGTWAVEYTMRLNNGGTFNLPSTRVEALYSPEMFGEMPNRKMEVVE